MAGLCAARALSERFERVTLVERDTFVDTPEPRKGVPQGRHLHGLLRGGEDLLEGWFPGLAAALEAGGAQRMEMGTEFRWFHHGGWKVHAPSGVACLGLSRPYLEQEVRRRVLALPNVTVRDGHAVRGLVADADRRRVTGVRLGADDVAGVVLAADLVVDATGRGSALPRWLSEIGRGAAREETIKVNVGYASRLYRRPPAGAVPWKACYVLGESPHSKRLGAVFSIEGDRWMIVLAGVLGDHPPADDQGFTRFARELPNPAIAEAMALTEPLGDTALYRFPAHQRRHYEEMADFPDGVVAIGDAHCSFNPIYGQGITCAALGAAELARTLDRDGLAPGATRRFQKALAKAIDPPWMMSTGEDLRYPEVEGTRPLWNGVMQWYTARVHRAVLHDPVVAREFYRAMNMVAPPTALAGVAWRVLRGGGERTQRSSTP
jgi:2-polyprenyl-6-methoxyphenol hydroxylase-like FAD-dependent oxidoreductase